MLELLPAVCAIFFVTITFILFYCLFNNLVELSLPGDDLGLFCQDNEFIMKTLIKHVLLHFWIVFKMQSVLIVHPDDEHF